MQTPTGRSLLVRHGIDPDDPISFLLLDSARSYTDTEAILRLLESFGGKWRALGAAAGVVPRLVRDPLYRWLARHRYRLFGRRDACMIPGEDIADRFLR
jgi:predicted DCC family thiol-disulfide oxidoreductase YuxK